MASAPRPLASVPWIKGIERTFYQNKLRFVFRERPINCTSDPEIQRKVALFKTINETFPYYLPIAHHQMSASKLVEEYPDGQYWGAAIYYLISTRGHGSTQWDFYQRQFANNSFNTNNQQIVTEQMKSSLLPENFRQCEEAREFLFEPWVLAQLPMQPDLLLQWLVAAYFEVANFANIMFLYPLNGCENIEGHKNLVVHFQTVVRETLSNIEAGFQLLQRFIDRGLTLEESQEFSYKLERLLIFLDFKINRNKTVIRMGHRTTSEKEASLVECNRLYDSSKKLQACMLNLFPQRAGNHQKFMFWNWETEENEGGSAEKALEDRELLPYFENFLCVCCNISKFDETCFSEQNARLQALYSACRDCALFHEISASLGEEQGILDIFLETEINLRIMDAKYEIFKSGVVCNGFIQECYNFFENLTLDEIYKCKLEAKKAAYTWSIFEYVLPKLKRKVGNDCKAASYPDMADYLEKKIKQIVMKRLFKYKNDNVLLDWHFPQFLLPCFVAFYIELDTQVDNRQFVTWYGDFVQALILTYECEEFDIVITAVEQEINTHLALFMKHHLSSHALLLSYMRKVSTALTGIFSSDEQVKKLSKFPLFQSFFEALEYGNRTKFPERSNEKIAQDTNKIWDVLTFDFFLRIGSSLIKTLGNPRPFYNICKWTPNVVDLIRTLLLFIQPIESNYLFYLEFTSSSQLLYDIFKHILRCTAEELEGLIQEIGKLTEAQILGIAFHLAMTNVSLENVLSKMKKVNESIDVANLKPSCGDVDIAFHSFLTDVNMWRLKEFYAVNLGEEAKVSLSYMMRHAPICCLYLPMEVLYYKDLWCYPIKLCRYCCSTVDPEHFLLCKRCKKEPNFPDKYFFCSRKCQKKYDGHIEEHNNYINSCL